LAGHSRGGQAAWRAAQLLGGECAGLMLVDPVDGGGGPRPAERTSTAAPVALNCAALIIGAGLGGRCAPAAVNHECFAEACPTATHVVVPDMGHADVLTGRALRLGRLLCGGGSDPAAARRQVTDLMLEFMGLA
jgi:pimeloyl-ACP methyl ester carboxylesterase